MSKVDEAINEIGEALVALDLPLEGLQDFERLNLATETVAEVRQARIQYTRRRDKLTKALNFLNELIQDGYPELEIPDVSISVKADLDAQQASISAALGKFKTDAANSLGLSAREPEEK